MIRSTDRPRLSALERLLKDGPLEVQEGLRTLLEAGLVDGEFSSRLPHMDLAAAAFEPHFVH